MKVGRKIGCMCEVKDGKKRKQQRGVKREERREGKRGNWGDEVKVEIGRSSTG